VPTGADITEEPLSRMRERIAVRMVESKTTIPHFYLTTEIEMAAALDLRKQINSGLAEDAKVTVNDLVVKAVALTLRKFPNLNSHFYGDKVVRYHHIHIGIAVALEGGGLINVVAKDADSTSISALAKRNKEMIAAVRANKVKPDYIEGSTFTVSNLGAYDIEHFMAIINPPEAGILAVGTAKEIPVVINGEIKIANRMKVTVSVDHRVSDGAEGAMFMKELKALLEAPMRLLV
jgi:pyruvate dehydrogenase E2 component (dihydrolipoamide acetyltransferase)